jgi:hypothetical protein
MLKSRLKIFEFPTDRFRPIISMTPNYEFVEKIRRYFKRVGKIIVLQSNVKVVDPIVVHTLIVLFQ